MQLTVRIPDKYKEKLDSLVEKTGLKRSDILRIALKKFIEEGLNTNQSKPFDRVKEIIGISESNIKDLGQSHRNYLKKKIRKKF